jgi:hypothetical protein
MYRQVEFTNRVPAFVFLSQIFVREDKMRPNLASCTSDYRNRVWQFPGMINFGYVCFLFPIHTALNSLYVFTVRSPPTGIELPAPPATNWACLLESTVCPRVECKPLHGQPIRNMKFRSVSGECRSPKQRAVGIINASNAFISDFGVNTHTRTPCHGELRSCRTACHDVCHCILIYN